MVYAKKLIVLTGTGGTGAVTLEKSAAGLNGRLNTYDLPDLDRGTYVLALLGNRDRIIDLGESGRMTIRFSLDPETELKELHCAVVRIESDKADVLLYGTLAPKKVWIGDIAEYVRRKRAARPMPVAAQSLYSSRRIEDYFLDVLPATGEFHDGAVANINYYAPDFGLNGRETPTVEIPQPPQEETTQAAAPTEQAEHISAPTQTETTQADDRESPPVARPEQVFAKQEQPVEPAVPKPPVRSLRDTPSALERDYLLKLASAAAMTATRKESAATATAVPPPQSDSFRLFGSQKTKPLSFYEMIRSKFDALLASGAPCAELENIMPDTHWVKIDYDGRRYYAVGLIGARPDYIGYGVPARYTPTAPEELAGYCNWIPLKASEPEGEGYWLLFQDADTGESITPDNI